MPDSLCAFAREQGDTAAERSLMNAAFCCKAAPAGASVFVQPLRKTQRSAAAACFSGCAGGQKRRADGAAGPLAAGRLGKARFSKPPAGVMAGNTDFFACGRVLKFHKAKNAFALAICVRGCYNKDAAPVGARKGFEPFAGGGAAENQITRYRRYGLKSCLLSRCKRESGSNPEQPPLLYLTRGERTEPLGYVCPEKACSLRHVPLHHKSGYLPCLLR